MNIDILKHDFYHKTTLSRWGYPVGVVIILLLLSIEIKGQDFETPKLNPLKYLDIGLGAGLPDGFGVVNAGISLDATDLLAVFIEYNMFLEQTDIYLHETNIKIGPYVRFNPYSYAALSAGFSFMFNTARKRTNTDYTTWDNYLFNIPLQIRFNFGINDWLGVGLKATYNMVMTRGAGDKGSVVVFAAYKLPNW